MSATSASQAQLPPDHIWFAFVESSTIPNISTTISPSRMIAWLADSPSFNLSSVVSVTHLERVSRILVSDRIDQVDPF